MATGLRRRILECICGGQKSVGYNLSEMGKRGYFYLVEKER